MYQLKEPSTVTTMLQWFCEFHEPDAVILAIIFFPLADIDCWASVVASHECLIHGFWYNFSFVRHLSRTINFLAWNLDFCLLHNWQKFSWWSFSRHAGKPVTRKTLSTDYLLVLQLSVTCAFQCYCACEGKWWGESSSKTHLLQSKPYWTNGTYFQVNRNRIVLSVKTWPKMQWNFKIMCNTVLDIIIISFNG